MDTFKPFQALLPEPDLARFVCAPPYDVLSATEAMAAVADNPLSYLLIEKSEVDYTKSGITGVSCHLAAHEHLKRLIADGILVQETGKRFYIYRQIASDKHTQYGIVGVISVDEYLLGRIKKHELTRVDKEAERAQHIDIINAHTGPVFVVYPENMAVNEIVAASSGGEPHIDFIAADGCRHSVWKVEDEAATRRLVDIFSSMEAFYIADGHHRAAAAAHVAKQRGDYQSAESGYFLSVLFPDTQVRIIDYNRLVRDLHGLSATDFLKSLEACFVVQAGFKAKSPQRAGEFGMYLAGAWYLLQFKSQPRDLLIGSLDVSILQDFVLAPILGITAPRSDERIGFIGGKRGMVGIEEAVDAGESAVGFALYPTRLSELIAIANMGMEMPPKSTWFEPKLLSGLFTHLLE